MKIALRTSGGRGEYELAGRFGSIAASDLFGLEILFDCTPEIEVSGHSPGHMIFYQAAVKVLIGGDVLFRESIGRTDLPGGNHEDLIRNIKEKVYCLPDDVTVYPGHGPETTIGHEKQFNPFVKA